MAEVWDLKPLVGVGPLRFGMTRGDVEAIARTLGPIYAEFTENGPDGSPILQQARDMEAPVLFFRAERLTGIQLDRYTKFDIVFSGTSIFGGASRDALIALENANEGALWGLGAVLFPKLSISTNGFFIGRGNGGTPQFWEQAPDTPPKVLNMEMADAYAPYLKNYTPISFQN
jgi:hypothetical protein